MAGLGTAGSLLIGATLLFVLASAVVGCDGWPKVAGSPPVPPQVISAGAVARLAESGVAQTVTKVTSTAGSAVSGVGSGAGKTVSKVTAAGGTVTGLGSKLSGAPGGS